VQTDKSGLPKSNSKKTAQAAARRATHIQWPSSLMLRNWTSQKFQNALKNELDQLSKEPNKRDSKILGAIVW
jgi:hypothetical protein